ncbi:gliding motility lipoprotein GldH [Robiginitalea sp. M366]|uniref:gliding motility lipoprotein GldH n=1 Tax=Robiginitalea aestuariiviva TaxID=3036903 RepID=UPI00240D6583|nr:gliding motility lipoprotein GldH [Robiginitalea aestuariiviva]MDG1571424.1 gliding motility lipoprotein GldH [Robiginitalea aestuariiviva]
MHRLLLILAVLLLGASCNAPAYSEYQSTQGGAWGRDQVMEFQFQPQDTTRAHNLYILLRNDASYPFSNLFLIAEMTGPDGTATRDTLEYEMADASGRWLGSGTGSVITNKLGFRRDVVFPENGVYTVRVSQAMRRNGSVAGLESLPGVLDVGLQLELKQD